MGDSNIITPSSMVETGEKLILPSGLNPMEFIENPVERLNAFNAFLKTKHLKPLRKLGEWQRGQIELIKVIGIFDHSSNFFTDIQFECRFPNGSFGKYAIRFNANGDVAEPAVTFCFINGKVAIVYQWRSPAGIWTYEVPRGFGSGKPAKYFAETDLNQITLSDLPIDTLIKVVGTEIAEFAEIRKVQSLGSSWQNTGTDAVQATYLLVDLRVDKQELEQRMGNIHRFSPYKLYLWDLQKFDEEIGLKINDQFSETAYLRATRYLKNHKFF